MYQKAGFLGAVQSASGNTSCGKFEFLVVIINIITVFVLAWVTKVIISRTVSKFRTRKATPCRNFRSSKSPAPLLSLNENLISNDILDVMYMSEGRRAKFVKNIRPYN